MNVWYVMKFQGQEVIVDVSNAEVVPWITGGAVWWERHSDPAEAIGYYLAYAPEGYNFSILVQEFLDYSAKKALKSAEAGEKHVVIDAKEVFKPSFRDC